MSRVRLLFAMVVWALVGAGCSGGGDGGLVFQSSTTTDAGTTTTDAVTTTTLAVSGQVGDDGLTLTLGDGSGVDVPAGALPAGATVTAETMDTSVLVAPEGTTFVGPALSITATEHPAEPVLVVLPLPADGTAEDLWLLHIADDGSQEIIGGAVERGEFVSAVTSFSDMALLHGKVSEILGIAGVPPVDLSIGGEDPESAPEESPLIAEQGQLILGERDEPAPRVVRIVGPGEVTTRDEAVSGEYSAVGFEARQPHFVEYTWNLYGGDGALLGPYDRPDRAQVTGMRPGRYTLTVDAYDPATGATAFAARRIFVVEGFVVAVHADRPGGYCCDQRPLITLGFTGGEEPVVIDYAVGGVTGQQVFDSTLRPPITWTIDPITADTVVELIGTDAGGATSSAMTVLHYNPPGPFALLSGPSSVAVGEEAVFTVETDQIRVRDLRFRVWPAAAVETNGRTVRVIWDEPGIGRVGVYEASDVHQAGVWPWSIDVLPIEITGEPLPVTVRVRNAPTSLSPGQAGTWLVRVRGGIVAAATGFRGYTVTVDFDDRTDPVEVQIPADTAAEFTEPFPIAHSYDEPGNHVVAITAVSPDGDSVTEEFPVEVAEQIVLGGEFTYPEPRNTPVWRVNENEIELVIRGTEVEVTRYANDTDQTYLGFTLGGGDVTPDCTFHEVYTLTGSDLTFDPDTQTITGTIQAHYFRTEDTGSQCPFGGRAGDEQDLESEIFQAVIVDGIIENGWLFGFFTASVVEP
ncbi:MAG: hypothetical protein KJ956_00570 [Actinobacteria bacterium]|nr:hypothetical protein [Actinomycetota bacterium]